MSTSTTKHRFLSGGSQQIKLTELSSQGISSSNSPISNGSGGWTQGASGAGASDLILWKWNETDTSQFRVAYSRLGVPTFSVQSGSGNPTLRVTFASKSSGEHSSIITISDFTASFVNTHCYRYELQFRMTAFSGTATEWYAFGPAVLCNSGTGTTFRGFSYGYKLATGGRLWKIENGAFTGSGATPNWGVGTNPLTPTNPVDGLSDTVYAKVSAKHSSSILTFRHDLFVRQNIAAAGGQTAMRGDSTWAISQVGAFDAGWNTHPLTTCGLSWLGTTGLGTNQYFEFDSLCIVKHPMDF